MDSTPKKPGVHWALDSSISDFGSPFTEGSSNESVSTSTSTLQYVNSQLISHGFTQNPGLSLDGLQKEDSERVMKCLMGMLGQRIEDLSRTEDFGAKIRTLSYEHERLTSMYKTVNDKALNAEREANSHKSKLASANQALQVSEMAHKRTTGELQRLRTSLQGLRETHKAELKKIEKEKDRMSERWNKLSDAQLKIGATIPSGIKFANQQVVEASDVQIRGKGKGFLEVSLEEAERSRKELAEQNRELKRIVLSAANDLQRIFWSAQNLTSSGSSDEPPPLTATALFPMTSLMVANTKMNSLLNNLKGLAERLAQENMMMKSSISIAQHPSLTLDSKSKHAPDRVEVERLKAEVGKLQQELEESRRQADNQATEAQALFDRFSGDKRLLNAETPSEISVNLITTPSKDEELERLENRARQLEQERTKFTEASVKLGKEKAALEEEKIRFLEEKRQWQVQQMLSDLPPTPPAEESVQPQHLRPPVDPSILLPRSPRKSPHKAKSSSSGLKSSPKPKKTRVSRRSSGLIPLSPKSKNIIPSYETEVIPSYPLPVPNFKTTLTFEPSSPNSLKAFVLPPPSPAAKIGGSPEVDKLLAPLPKVDFGSAFATTSELQPSLSDGQPVSATSIPSNFPASTSSSGYSASSSLAVSSALQVPVPSTPLSNRPFPMAKPLASRMIHAYSPAKPSPLSRILMLANSPESPDNDRRSSGASSLDAVLEEDEDDTPEGFGRIESNGPKDNTNVEGRDQSPLQEEDLLPAKAPKIKPKVSSSRVNVKPSLQPHVKESKRSSTMPKEKGKVRVDHGHSSSKVRSSTTIGVMEKENNKVKRTRTTSLSKKTLPDGAVVKKSAKSVPLDAGKAGTSAGIGVNVGGLKLGAGGGFKVVKGAARRVPIDSAEAAPTGRTWRG